ncbi:ankyrin repeat-containing protein [Pusillimonas sp. T7-7]|nr:ankyrin repeat-containing protein [Pusillimonas sp. T7-7]
MISMPFTQPATPNQKSCKYKASGFFRVLVQVLAGLLLCGAAHAANPESWWVDIANDRVAKIQNALARGADPNELSPDGQPAIMQAIRDGAWKVYDVLAAYPKTVRNAININRETPLMYLAVMGQTQRAQDLINRGALVNRLGWTPLQYAASKGHLDTVKMLIANKAIVNAPGPDGTTALMMAAYGGNEAVVQYLLDAGADVTMKTTQQYDAARWARLKKHNELADKLDALSAKVLAQRGGGAAGSTTDAAQAPASSAGKTTTNSSTSRYFDLDRFNEEATP